MSVARVRLHITPFNPSLQSRIIPPSLEAHATNISFHTVQTFPEHGFGYVELPIMEAEKLKSKLNGTTLKGAKVKIEEARSEKKRQLERQDVEENESRAGKRMKTERKHREPGVLQGQELEEGRRVKRGWTEATTDGKSKAQKSSKHHDERSSERKLKFKTSLPPTVAVLENEPEQNQKRKNRKTREAKGKVIVEEFAKRKKTADSSLPARPRPLSYEDGIGWVDDEGTVVEAARSSRNKTRKEKGGQSIITLPAQPVTTPMDVPATKVDAKSDNDDTSTHSESSSEVSSDGESAASSHGHERDVAMQGTEESTIPSSDTQGPPPEVHPLEALYKRSAKPGDSIGITQVAVSPSTNKPRPAPIDTSFSFFQSDAAGPEDEADSVADMPPHTPHTREDLEWRTIRSAAPTPDTAAIGKRFAFPVSFDEDEEDEDVDHAMHDSSASGAVTGQTPGGSNAQPQEESEFRKWFYDNRGDLNRAWKQQRRVAKKQQRQRENRRLSRRVV